MKVAVWLALICASWLVVMGAYGVARSGWSAFAPHEQQVLQASVYTGVNYPPADPRPRWPARVAPASLVSAVATTRLKATPKALHVVPMPPRICLAASSSEKASCIEL